MLDSQTLSTTENISPFLYVSYTPAKQAKTAAQQPSVSHMPKAKIFPHSDIPNNQSISSMTPPSPAPQSGSMLNYSMCSVVRLSWLRLCRSVSVSASPPADCQIFLLLLAGSEAETHTSSHCSVDMNRAKNSLTVGVWREFFGNESHDFSNSIKLLLKTYWWIKLWLITEHRTPDVGWCEFSSTTLISMLWPRHKPNAIHWFAVAQIRKPAVTVQYIPVKLSQPPLEFPSH